MLSVNFPQEGGTTGDVMGIPFLGKSAPAPNGYLSDKSLALIGNASGPGAEGGRNCSEAFSIRRLEGRRWQWWALLWSCVLELASVNAGKSLEVRGGSGSYARWGCVEGVIPRSARREKPVIRL
jgi:hypothetical protein